MSSFAGDFICKYFIFYLCSLWYALYVFRDHSYLAFLYRFSFLNILQKLFLISVFNNISARYFCILRFSSMQNNTTFNVWKKSLKHNANSFSKKLEIIYSFTKNGKWTTWRRYLQKLSVLNRSKFNKTNLRRLYLLLYFNFLRYNLKTQDKIWLYYCRKTFLLRALRRRCKAISEGN